MVKNKKGEGKVGGMRREKCEKKEEVMKSNMEGANDGVLFRMERLKRWQKGGDKLDKVKDRKERE